MDVDAVPPAPTEAAVPAEPASVREIPIEFRGNGAEYFRIWIVNLLLTIVTIGIYSAWAKVRRLRYFHGSTVVDGHAFDYHARPVAILKGRTIAFALYLLLVFGQQFNPLVGVVALPLLFFGLPWLMLMSKRFQMRMTSWRGLRFRFGGSYGGALATYTGWPLLVGLTLGVLFPFWQWKNASWVVTNTAYGAQRFAFTTRAGRYYVISLVGSLLLVGLLVAGFLAAGALSGASGLEGFPIDPSITDPRERIAAMLRPGVLLTLLVPAMVLQLVVAWFLAGLTNAAIGGVMVGPHRLESRLRTWPMAFILVTNLIGVVLTNVPLDASFQRYYYTKEEEEE